MMVGRYRTIVNRHFGRIRFVVDCESTYWTVGVSVSAWYIRVDIGPVGISIMGGVKRE